MSNPWEVRTGRCSCGNVQLGIGAPPLYRIICHCQTCQQYTGSDHADVTVFKQSDVEIRDPSQIDMRSYQKASPVLRGKCTQCGDPVVESASVPLFPDLTILPTAVLEPDLHLSPSRHIFYHRRQHDAEDNLPKHSSFASSQLAFVGSLIKALLQARRQNKN